MPIPVSRTSTTVPVGVSIALIVTLPWCEVNFTALLTRLWTMWRRLRASNTTCIKRSTCEVTVSSFWLAAAAFSDIAASTASATRQGAGWSSSRPAWLWVRSRMSLISVRRRRPAEFPCGAHGQPQGRAPAVLLGQGIERKSAVELNVLGEDGTLLDDDLGDKAGCDASQLVFGDARLHAVPDLNRLLGGVAGLGQRDETGHGARDTDQRLGDALQQGGRSHRSRGQRLGDLAEHLHRGLQPQSLLAGLLSTESG